jgi:protein tyrosine phosphatase
VIKKAAEPHYTDVGGDPAVADKNQYPEILPYDHNRVILTTLNDEPTTSYINASYVDVGFI